MYITLTDLIYYYYEKDQKTTIFLFNNSNIILAKKWFEYLGKIVIKRFYIRKYHRENNELNQISKKVTTDHFTTEEFYTTNDRSKNIFISKNLTSNPKDNVLVSEGVISPNRNHYIYTETSYVKVLENREDIDMLKNNWKHSKVDKKKSKAVDSNDKVKASIDKIHVEDISKRTGISQNNLKKVSDGITNNDEAILLLESMSKNYPKD